MNIYQILTKVFIALTAIISTFSGDIEYRTALLAVVVVYIFFFLIIPKSQNFRYITLILDMMFISFIIYLTGYTFLSLLIIPLFTDFVKDIKDTATFLALSVIPLGLSLYLSNFTEYIFFPIAAASFISIFGLYQQFKGEKQHFFELEEKMNKLYIKNISYEEQIDRLQNLLDVYLSFQKLRKNRFPIKRWIYDLNEKLGIDGIIFFDYMNKKCYSTKKVSCDGQILKYIEEPFMEFKNHEVNQILNAPYVWTLIIEHEDKLFGIFIFVSKLKEINPQAIEMVKDQLTLYFIEKTENSQNQSSD